MRILFVNRMAAMVRGGGETFDLEIARHLESLGCQTSFLTGLPLSRSTPDVVLDHPRVHFLRSPYSGNIPWDKFRLGWRIRIVDFRLFEIAAARWICKNQEKFDLVQICEMPPLITELQKRNCRLPQVIRITAPDYHDADNAVKKAHGVIASGTSMEFLRKHVRPDCFNVPNGVDLNQFCRGSRTGALRSQLGISDEAVVFVHVARFQAVKNHRMLIEAFAQLTGEAAGSSHLLLAGGGPLEPEVRSQVSRAGLASRVHFLGEVPFAKVPELYASADINLVSSDYESFSFSALEGMASQLPLITTDTDWVPRLIDRDQGGLTVPVGNAPEYAAAMDALAGNSALRDTLGAWNRRRVEEQYGWASSAEKLKRVYEALLEQQESPCEN